MPKRVLPRADPLCFGVMVTLNTHPRWQHFWCPNLQYTHLGDKLTFGLKIAMISKRPKWGTPIPSLTDPTQHSDFLHALSFVFVFLESPQGRVFPHRATSMMAYPSGDLQVAVQNEVSEQKAEEIKGTSQFTLRKKASDQSKHKLFLWIMLIHARNKTNYFFLEGGRHCICYVWLLLSLTWNHFSQLHYLP